MIRLSANYPGPGAPPRADGTGFYLFLVQNTPFGLSGETIPGYTNFYIYWPKQLANYGDTLYPDGFWRASETKSIVGKGAWMTDPDFTPLPNFQPQRDRWRCYELMVKANTPGKNDGKLASRFPNLNFRSISTLKLDKAVVMLHAKHSERVNKKWYDNVVIARQYIGPMASPIPSPTPTPTPKPTPTPTPTPAPTVTPNPSPYPPRQLRVVP